MSKKGKNDIQQAAIYNYFDDLGKHKTNIYIKVIKIVRQIWHLLILGFIEFEKSL